MTDDAGTAVRLAQPARRVVTLAPNLTELAFAAGLPVVAVGRHSDHPAAARALPQVGDAFMLNLEAIRAQRPDLVLVWQSGTPQRSRDALKELARREGFAVFESEIRSVEDIARTLERLGRLGDNGTQAGAGRAAAALRADWQALQQRWAAAAPLRVFYQVWDAPLMTFNGQHLVTKALHACGARTGFDALPALTPSVNREAVAAFDPQLILTGDPAVDRSLAAWRPLSGISAVARGALRGVDGATLTRMGPRFVQAAQALCEVIDRARSR